MTANLAPVAVMLTTLLVLVTALSLTALLRRRAKPDRPGVLGLLSAVARPALVLVFTPGAIWLAQQSRPLANWLDAHEPLVDAWRVFWLGALALALVEGTARQIWAVRRRPFPVPDLLGDIVRVLTFLLLAFAVAKIELGWDIGPLLASTALVTAVIGFALQGVLGNLLAGMSLHLTRSVQPGDWIALAGEAGPSVEGKVTCTNWRETRIQTVNHEELIVPNSFLSNATIHNLGLPTPARRHRIDVGASYSDAPDEVIDALTAAARAVPEVMEKPAPHALVTEFQDYGINYRLLYWTRQYHRRGWIDGQVSRHIWYQFKRCGIEIPFPMSDKLLNDFMAVVYNQRKLEPERPDVAAVARDLAASDLHRKLVVDADGQPLLGPEELRRLAGLVRREKWTHGEVVMRQGDEGSSFYVVAGGKLAGTVDHGHGEPVTRFELGEGAVVGEMSLLTGAPRAATLTTATSCELLVFERDAFVALLSLHPEVPEHLAKLAADRQAANVAAAADARAEQAAAADHDDKKAGILRHLLGLIGR
ncbi:MAG: mechanosensitive ion channel family protein [Candidatus Krumholzibacteriia bacterium]